MKAFKISIINPKSIILLLMVIWTCSCEAQEINKGSVLLSRTGVNMAAKHHRNNVIVAESLIPAGVFDMGDHFGFVDPSHPSDEIPIHSVKVDSFYMADFETTNQQFLEFLDSSWAHSTIIVQNHCVYLSGDTNIICYTNQYEPWYSIGFDGTSFSMTDFRANHPMVGVMWNGAVAFCNWLSLQNGLQACYDLTTWNCDFSKTGYRLPTEAEWEYAARGGQINPYLNYPMGNTVVTNLANLPDSGDPYETGSYPFTTPVGFYDGSIKQKSVYNWPGAAISYQTINGMNPFGLYDMQGNVWEFVNDWYSQNYYSVSPIDNPKGPSSGFIMPDGKPYHGMRGGKWYNGYISGSANDGHSRVSNRNPSYYRGPLDPNHPWYHIGFRIARKLTGLSTGLDRLDKSEDLKLDNYPNPFSSYSEIRFDIPESTFATLEIFNQYGQHLTTLLNNKFDKGSYTYTWSADNYPSGMYICILQTNHSVSIKKMIHIK